MARPAWRTKTPVNFEPSAVPYLAAPIMSEISLAFRVATLAVLLAAGHLTAQEWTKFSSPGGGFSIVMPGNPTEGTFNLQTGNTKVTAHAFTVLSPSIDLMCGYYDFPSIPQDPTKVFDETRNGSISNIHGTLINEENVTLDGYPGRRFRSTGIGKVFVDEEMYLVGRRFYLITITTTTKMPNKAIKTIFDSFHLTVQKPTNTAPDVS
jgi:hypothetical protein